MVARSLHRFDPVGLGPWTLTARAGTGTGTVVYRAVDRIGRQAAVKAPVPYCEDSTVLSRLAHEARALKDLRLAGVARLLDDGSGAHMPYVATELVDGPSVRSLVDRRGPLRTREIEVVALALASTLADLHRAGVVHGDLKPTNVLVGRTGPVIIDFDASVRRTPTPGGAAPPCVDEPTADMMLRASPSWLAPEQAIGMAPTPATDVFAWATLLVFLATGHSPFGQGDAAAMLYRVVHEEPNLSGMTGPLAPIAAAALRKDPARRPTAGALARVLEGLRDRRSRRASAAHRAA